MLRERCAVPVGGGGEGDISTDTTSTMGLVVGQADAGK
jgi:hypothetical protein